MSLLDRKISLKDLLFLSGSLTLGFGVCTYLSNHQTINTFEIFTGAIVGVAVTFTMAFLFSHATKGSIHESP